MRVRVWFGKVAIGLLPATALLLATLLLATLVTGCRRGPAETKQLASPTVTVAHPVVRTLTDEDEFSGWLRASATVEVRARVRGHIQTIGFQDGDIVEKGQLLFELDPRPFQMAADQSNAEKAALIAQRNAENEDVKRYTELAASGGASKQELEKSQADAASYEARIAAKSEEVRQHELDFEFSRVTAAIAGRASRAMLTIGNLVNAGGSDTLLTTIVAVDPIYAYFNIDERSLQRYQRMRGDAREAELRTVRERKLPFRFALESDTDFPYAGMLDFAENKIDSTTGTIEVRGTVENKNGVFYPGSRIRVRVQVGDAYEALLVPDTAVLSDQDKKYLLVLGQGNHVLRRNVTLGRLLDDGMRVIVPGKEEDARLRPEDWVITIGLQRARINEEVEPVDVNAKPVLFPSA
jgi:multidrug efflux system membrane fusion protein